MNIKTRQKLSFKITLEIVAVITVIIAVICAIISTSMMGIVKNMSQEKIEFLAEKNAKAITDYLNTLEEKAASLNSVVKTYANLHPEDSKALTKQFFTSSLEDKRIFGIYLALEPNLYYKNTPDGYSFYAYNSETGIVYENYDYPDYKDGEFYTVPKQTLKPYITEPYPWTLTNGQVIWLITMTIPLLDSSGNFIGITTCDVNVDTINNLQYDMGDYKTAYSYILTDMGNYVVHSEDAEKYGTAYDEPGEKDQVLSAAADGERRLFEDINQVYGGQAYKVHVPLKVNNVDTAWTSAFVVNKSEVLGSVNQLVYLVIGISVAGIILLIIVSSLLLRRALKPVKSIVTVASGLENGQLASNLQVSTTDELGQLSQIFNRTAKTLSGYIKEISGILGEISNGNLTMSVTSDYKGDFEPIKEALSVILTSMNSTFTEIITAAEYVTLGASQVASGSQTLASGATEQAAAIQQLSASIAQISEDVGRNAQNVKNASVYIDQAGNGVRQSNTYMQSLLSAMQKISDSSQRISGIIKIIDDISFQTNILALNAAVEAARAGQAGKGFAVVAEEVRNLATKSANAARQTSELIGSSIDSIKEGMQLAESTSKALSEVAESAVLVENTNAEISSASQAQAMAISEIEAGLSQVSHVIQTITATAEENAAASEELSSQAEHLNESVSFYKLKARNKSAFDAEAHSGATPRLPGGKRNEAKKPVISLGSSASDFGKY